MTAVQPTRAAGVTVSPSTGRVAFITGCGRSGTTILGRMLSKHRDVSYLNDQFMLWASVFPEFEICGWLPYDPRSGPAVALGAGAADDAARRRFRAALESRREGRAVIVEKLAVNNFRMPFLRALMPECLLINIVRHGVDVAASIARRAKLGRWWGPYDRKWDCLCGHARANGYGDLLPLCTTDFHRGLLEWRMSVDAADEFFAGRQADRVLRLRYEDLVARPTDVCEQLERFLGIIARPVMRQFATGVIARQTPPASARPWPEHTHAIAGPALVRLGYSPPDRPAGAPGPASAVGAAARPARRVRLGSAAELGDPRYESFMRELNEFARPLGLRETASLSKAWEYPWLWINGLERFASKGMRVVDIGSERSPMPWALAVRGARVTLIETNPGHIPLWASVRERLGVDVDWRIVGSHRIPLMDGEADAVTSFSVIEHQADKRGAVGEAARVLRPEGVLALSFDISEPSMGMTFPEWNGRALTMAEFEETIWRRPEFGPPTPIRWNVEDIPEFLAWHRTTAPHHTYVVGAAVLIRR